MWDRLIRCLTFGITYAIMDTMTFFDNEMTIYFDVDDTLVTKDFDTFSSNYSIETKKDINVSTLVNIVDPYINEMGAYYISQPHIDLLKKHKAKGYLVVVWSQGGSSWAKNVVEALNLEKYVDLVITKPVKFVDDLPPNAFLTGRIFMED